MPVYLDHAADSPIHPDAAAAMTEWLCGRYGNPSGSHQIARRARLAVDEARETVAAFIGSEPGGVVFTGSGTEADNLAVLGPLAARPGAVVVSSVEHPAVLRAALASGREVRVVGVGPDGLVDLEDLDRVLGRDVALVSVQAANQETGVLQPVPGVAGIVRRRAPGAVLHTDAVQAAGWLGLPEATAGADLVTISAHKIGGPQGVGVLAVRGDTELAPVIHGGGQERERRAGTHNVAGIVGLAAAINARAADPGARLAMCRGVEALRDRLAALVLEAVPGSAVTASSSPRLPGHCHVRLPGLDSEDVLFLLDERGVCASAGPACASGALDPSPVLMAMGFDDRQSRCVLRLTLGPATTDADVQQAAAALGAVASGLSSPVAPTGGDR